MTTISTRVATRIEHAHSLLDTLHTHLDRVASQATRTLPTLRPSDLSKLLRVLSLHLARTTEALHSSEQAYIDEMADAPTIHSAHDNAIEHLYKLLSELRGFIRSHAPDRLSPLLLTDDPPSATDALLTYTRHAAQLLSQDPTPIHGLFGMTLLPSTAADALSRYADILSATLPSSPPSPNNAHITHPTLTARDHTLSLWEATFAATCDTLSGLYLLANEPTLAAQVRETQKIITESDASDLPLA